MEVVSALSTASEVIGSGLGVWVITEIVKKSKSIPWVNSGDTSTLRSLAAALSAISVVVLGFSDNNLQPQDLQTMLQALLAVGVTWVTAHATHKAISK